MDDREVVALDAVGVEADRALVGLPGREVHVDLDLLVAVAEGVDVERFPDHGHAAGELGPARVRGRELGGLAEAPRLAAGEAHLVAHDLLGELGADSRRLDLGSRSRGRRSRGDVGRLGDELGEQADEDGLASLVVDVPGEREALAVEHLEQGEFGHVAEGPALDGHVGEEYGVGARLEDGALEAGLGYRPAAHEVLDDVGRAAAEDVTARPRESGRTRRRW